MTPVEDGTTSSCAHPSSRATSAHDSRASRIPASPVKLLAHPEFATTACKRPDLTRSAVTYTGAAFTRFALKTAAAGTGRSAAMIPRSSAPALVFKPALTPANRNPRTAAGSRSTFIKLNPVARDAARASLAVTAFVFLAGAARAWIVASDLIGFALGRRRRLRLSLVAVAHHDALRLGLLNLLDVLLALHLDRKNFLDHVLLHHGHQRLEHREPFFLVLDQRIHLRIAAQPDSFLQMVHREQMVFPKHVERLQHHDLFDLPHHRLGEFRLALIVKLMHALGADIDQVVGAVNRLAVEIGLRVEAGAELELLEERVVDRLPVPLRGIDFIVAVRTRDFLDQRVAHVEHVGLERRAAEQLAPAMVHHLALLVHDVVVFEQMFADVEVMRLDFFLRIFYRARDPSMLDRHAVFHANSIHQALQAVGAKDAQQVVFERKEKSR